MSSLTLTVEPSVEPLTLSVIKTHLRLGSLDVEDELIQKVYAPGARKDVEHVTHRALITQTWVYRCNQFPRAGPLRLPRPPLQSVTSVQYVDSDGVTQVWDAASYVVDPYSTPGVIEPVYGGSFPTSRGDRNSVLVTFVAGYGTEPATVPADIRHAMLLILGDNYAQREDTQILTSGERALEQLPKASQRLLSPYVLPVFG